MLSAIILLGLGYEWGRRQVPPLTILSSPPMTGLPKVPKKPLSELFNGLTLQSSLITPESNDSASIVRTQPESYRVEIAIHAVLPRPNLSAEQISKLIPTLPDILKNFDSLMNQAKLSPAFTQLYENKLGVLRQNLFYLERAVSRQNFYDCETILNLRNSRSGRRAILAIGPMDVNTDGSDGDRNVRIDKTSLTFQPTTSYRWSKTSKRLNPFIDPIQRELNQISEQKTSEKTLTLNQRQAFLTRRLRELNRWSFLASTADPFIVLPEFFFRKYSGPFAPQIGDFALVLYKGVAYPAIVGDAGPSYKFGEASLRICHQINKASSGLNRAVTPLRVAYLVFPGTALKPWQTPDLKIWNSRCASLLEEFGGDTKTVFQWKTNFPPWPQPPGVSPPPPRVSTSSPPFPGPSTSSASPSAEPLSGAPQRAPQRAPQQSPPGHFLSLIEQIDSSA